MGERTAYTIKTLLEELKKRFPCFKKDQIFETLKSIYPNDLIDRKNRIIKFNHKEFTKPLAVSSKDKAKMLKESNKMLVFFRNVSRGDFLKVIKTDGKTAKCVNVSLKESVKRKYYGDEQTRYLTINFDDMANGNIKLVKRKIDKYLK